jgi:Flp pilus assembly secretin CpaC
MAPLSGIGELAEDPPPIVVQIRLVGFNRDKVGLPLIESEDGKLVEARVKDPVRLLAHTENLHGIHTLAFPSVATVADQGLTVSTGTQINIKTAAGLVTKILGHEMTGTVKLRKDGRVQLALDLMLTEPRVTNPTTEEDVEVCNIKTELQLRDGETAFIGGVSRRCVEAELVRLPFLGELPAVGSWFQFTRHVEYEQELFVLVTANVQRDRARNITPPPPPKTAPKAASNPR